MCLQKASITQSPKTHASFRENFHCKHPKSQFEIDSLCMHEQTCLSKPENPERDRHTYTCFQNTIQLSHLLTASFKEIIIAHKTTLDTICAGKKYLNLCYSRTHNNNNKRRKTSAHVHPGIWIHKSVAPLTQTSLCQFSSTRLGYFCRMLCKSLFIPSLRMRLYLGMTEYATITETGSWCFCNNGTL